VSRGKPASLIEPLLLSPATIEEIHWGLPTEQRERKERAGMAEIVSVAGESYKKRNPLGVWGLGFLTLGIYYFVWYYKINDEARRYLSDESIRPGIAVVAITLGVLILVPPFVSIYNTGGRILRMEQKASVSNEISPALGLLASLVLSLHVVYMQEHLNRVWDQAATATVPPSA
jgi:Domain of unknown function (DUF4234)